MNADEAYRFCRAITHKHGGNFSVGFRFLPRVKRQAVYAAYAYCRVADDIADEGISVILSREACTERSECDGEGSSSAHATQLVTLEDPSTALRPSGAPPAQDDTTRLRTLAAWQRELDACYDGAPTHPITIALTDALKHFAIPKSAFVALIDGCRQDMVKTRYETFDELLHYCDLVATSISDISLSIFGYKSSDAPRYGRNLSTALQLTNVTRDIGDDLTRDRVYVPQEELRRFGVEERDLVARNENERMRALVEFQIARAESYFREAEPLLRELAFDARFPVLLMGGVYATVLAKLRDDPFAAIRDRLSLSTLQKALVVGSRVLRPHFV